MLAPIAESSKKTHCFVRCSRVLRSLPSATMRRGFLDWRLVASLLSCAFAPVLVRPLMPTGFQISRTAA
jgi:hypothetical protein